MKYKFILPLALIFSLPLFSTPSFAAGGQAHAHIGHVMTSWGDTPKHMGLLPTAIAEAKIAYTHAKLAAKDTSNLKLMKVHTTHVLNAIDPSLAPKGPGLGYGVLAAAKGAAAHIGFAAKSKDASKNVKLHAVHVAAAANNTIKRVKKMSALAKNILAATSAGQAAPMVKKMVPLAAALNAG